MEFENQGTLNILIDDMLDNFLNNPSGKMKENKKILYIKELSTINVNVVCDAIRQIINDPELNNLPKIGYIKNYFLNKIVITFKTNV